MVAAPAAEHVAAIVVIIGKEGVVQGFEFEGKIQQFPWAETFNVSFVQQAYWV